MPVKRLPTSGITDRMRDKAFSSFTRWFEEQNLTGIQ